MVDSIDHLELIAAPAPGAAEPVRVCIELDVGFHLARGRVKIGPKRSSIRTPEQAVAIAREIAAAPRPGAGGPDGLRGPHRRRGRPTAGQAAPGAGDPPDAARLGEGDRRAPGAGGGGRARGGAAGAGQRRRHRQPAHHLGRAGGDRAHRRIGLLRPDAVRPLLGLPAAPGGDVRAAGGAPPGQAHRHSARRRLPGLRCRRARTACPSPTCPRA